MVKGNWAKGAQKGDKRKRLDDDDGTKTQLGLAVLDDDDVYWMRVENP